MSDQNKESSDRNKELYQAIVINPFKNTESSEEMETMKQSAIDLYNDIITTLEQNKKEQENND